MIKCYEEMAQRFGGVERAQQFSRFYPVPNMGHRRPTNSICQRRSPIGLMALLRG
jgi:hypothetical protein